MSKPKAKPRGKPFAVGSIPNPIGANAHKPETKSRYAVNKALRRIRIMTEMEFHEMLLTLMRTPPDQLQEELNKNPSVIKMWLGSAMAQGIKDSNTTEMWRIIERLFGKTKERMEVSTPDRTAQMTDEELEARRLALTQKMLARNAK